MKKITDIKPPVKNKTRCSIFLDNAYYCGLELETVMRNRLKIGTEIQPSEFMKPVMALFVAAKIQEKQYDLRTFSGMLRMFVWVGIVGVLMFLEPHVSGAVVICGIAGVVMLCGGAKWKNLFIPSGWKGLST